MNSLDHQPKLESHDMKKFSSARLRLLALPAPLKLALVAAVATSVAASVCAPDVGQPDFTLLVGTNPPPLAPGATGSVDFTITPLNGFNNNLTVALNDFGLLRDGQSGKAEAVPQASSAKAVQVDNFATVTRQVLPVGATSAHVVFQVNADATAGVHTLELAVYYGADFDKKGHILSVPVTVTAPLPSSYSLSVQTAPITVPANTTSASDIVAITRTSFAGAITLSGAGEAGSGITVNVTSQPGTDNQGTFTVHVPSHLTARTYQVTLTAQATGLTAVTTTFGVIVPGYTLNVQTAPLAVAAGTPSVADNVAIVRSAFTGAVTITGTSDDGITVVASAPTTGNLITLAISVPSSAAIRDHVVNLIGTADGLENVPTPFTVSVTAAATNVAYTFCAATGLPVWVAVQDGTGTWTAVTGSSNVYAFNISAATGGIAYVEQPGSTDLHIFYGTKAELQTQGAGSCGSGGALKTISGVVANTGTAATAFVGLGSAQTQLVRPAISTFQLTHVPSGPLDLVGATVDGVAPQPNALKMLLRRGVNLTDGSNLGVLDFTGAEAVPAFTRTLTPNLFDQGIGVTYAFQTSNQALATYYNVFTSTGPTLKLFGFPATSQVLGDLYYIAAQAYNGTGSTTSYRIAGVAAAAIADMPINFGSVLTVTPPTTLATTPYARLHAALSVTTEYNKLFETTYQQSFGSNRNVFIQMTGGYTNGAATATMDIPDFSAVAGWSNTWGPLAGFLTHWIVTASNWSGTTGIVFPTLTAGTTFNSATKQGDITP